MKHVRDLPNPVREMENAWIPMPDGTRLAARIWMPDDAKDAPVPALLEYIPYRKRDMRASVDSMNHRYLAGHGYAGVRVDIRGSGDSEGVLRDEYLQEELDDGLAIIRWLAEQPWCDGTVGMFGISWGGFNALQVAALQPPALKAILTVCSTDDRYADDVHHMGGCLLGDNLSWSSIMLGYNSCPPDPAVVGERWRAMWKERLQGSGHWLIKWLRHQRRDHYWKHGSVCEDLTAIRCPVFAVSGWADGYSNSVFRLMAGLDVPRKGLIGPWSHMYPHVGRPGPAIGFLQESLRWWDHWLKGEDRGLMDEPMLRVWMQDSVDPVPRYKHRPGRWVAEPTWPSPDVSERRLPLATARLLPDGEAGDDAELSIQSPLSVGLFAGKWCSYADAPDLPHDQREEDGGALVFDSDPLEDGLEILGAPEVDLALASNKPVAMVAVRLSDVAPDGQATRVTYGLLNLTHRDSHEHPGPLEPGRRYRVRVRMNDVAQTFRAGHQVRLSVSTSYWPLAWPPPELPRLTVWTDSSALLLPVRPPRDSDARLRPFEGPEAAEPDAITIVESGHHNWLLHRDMERNASVLEVIGDDGTYRVEYADVEVGAHGVERYRSVGNEVDGVRGETRWSLAFRRPEDGWDVRTECRTVLTSTPTHFRVVATLDAWEGDRRVHAESWDEEIPRDNV
ncbi:MAG: CocE/NonD family hydrolase [Myxococcota bacterium]